MSQTRSSPLSWQLYNQQNQISGLLKGIIATLLDEFELATSYHNPDKWSDYDQDIAGFHTEFDKKLKQKLGLTDSFNLNRVEPLLNDRLQTYLTQSNLELSDDEYEELYDGIMAELFGFGPLEPLLEDETITDIIVHGPGRVYFRRGDKFEPAPLTFWSNDHLLWFIDRITLPLGGQLSEDKPTFAARLPDGSRVSIAIPPVSLVGPAISIQKFHKQDNAIDEMIGSGALSQEMFALLQGFIKIKANILICGANESDVVQWTNTIASLLPDDDVIVTIETIATLQIPKPHVLTLEAGLDERGQSTFNQVLDIAARFLTERMIIGNISGPELFPVLRLMQDGVHNGVILTTSASGGVQAALSRLEILTLLARPDLPLRVVRYLIAGGIDVVIVVSRLKDGAPKISSMTQIIGIKEGTIATDELVTFVQTGEEDGRVQGRFEIVARQVGILSRLRAAGVFLDPKLWPSDG